MESNPSSAVRSVSGCSNSTDWLNRICEIQRSKATPEVLQSLQERASKQKRALKSYKAADMMERCNNLNSRAQTSNLRKAYYISPSFASSTSRVTSAAALPPPPQAEYVRQMEELTVKSVSAAQNVQSVLRNFRSDFEENEDLLTAQLEQLEVEADADEKESSALPASLCIAADPSQPIGFDALLESLSTEPADPTEMAAKFAVFENFLSTVVAIREETISFWEDNKDQFEGAARLAGEKSIKDIDNPDSLSIAESSSIWFVYFMMRKAQKNSQAISNTLSAIKARLELMSKEDIECPFCLDPILSEDCIVLGCCHKTCRGCWANWQEIKGTHAFCPLCRHEAFVQEVLV